LCYGAVIFLDLDNFKSLNDTHGHEMGDLLLIEVAHRITHCVREMDTVARFGGDEFVVMLGELDVNKERSAEQAAIVAEKIRVALAEPYVLVRNFCQLNQPQGSSDVASGKVVPAESGVATPVEHQCTSSIGVVLFVGNDASQEDILKWADMAMYQAKEGGRDRVRFFDGKS
jgi:GGDEF domain-containing protein